MTAWSYSSLTAFETCPRRFHLTRITKQVVEAQTEATTHGNEVHKALELAVKLEQLLPEKYAAMQPLVDTVLRSEGVKETELKFGLTSAFKPTGFFSPDVWCRGVIDLCITRPTSAINIDWKTGKPKPDSDQLKLFAAATFSLYPQVQKVRTGFAWLAYNKLDPETYEREQVPGIWREFIPRVNKMERAIETGQFPPKPSGLCKAWCPCTRAHCEFSGRSA